MSQLHERVWDRLGPSLPERNSPIPQPTTHNSTRGVGTGERTAGMERVRVEPPHDQNAQANGNGASSSLLPRYNAEANGNDGGEPETSHEAE